MMLLIEKLGSYRKETDDVVSRLKIINELSSNIALKNIVTKMIDTYTSSSFHTDTLYFEENTPRSVTIGWHNIS